MPETIYNSDDIIEKTLFAAQRVPVYDNAPPYRSANPIGYVEPGNPVGIVYSYLQADPTRQRANLWWMFYPSSQTFGKNYYAEQVPGYYDVSKLREQGVISLEEQKEQEETANLPWYEQLIVKYGKPILIGGVATMLAVAAIKGYFSRPKSNP